MEKAKPVTRINMAAMLLAAFMAPMMAAVKARNEMLGGFTTTSRRTRPRGDKDSGCAIRSLKNYQERYESVPTKTGRKGRIERAETARKQKAYCREETQGSQHIREHSNYHSNLRSQETERLRAAWKALPKPRYGALL